MAERREIGLRDIKALKPGGTLWDAKVAGFGARRQKGNAVAYVVTYRTGEGRLRWHTIGRHGAPWTPVTAREEAKAILGRVVRGADPAAEKQRHLRRTRIPPNLQLSVVQRFAQRVPRIQVEYRLHLCRRFVGQVDQGAAA